MTLASLLAALFLAVPAPGDSKDDAPPPEPTGPAPRILFVKADADGKVMFTVRRQNVNAQVGRVMTTIARVELKEVADLAITSPNGTKIELADAQKKIVGGAYVLMPADGKAIAPGYLRMFKSDVLVLTSPELLGISPTVRAIGNVPPGGGFQIQPLPVPIQPAPVPNGK